MKKDSKCPVTTGEVDLSKYEKVDGTWRELGLAAPARRALVNANLLKIADLMKITKSDFLDLHGMGPKAADVLEKEMKRKKISFKK